MESPCVMGRNQVSSACAKRCEPQTESQTPGPAAGCGTPAGREISSETQLCRSCHPASHDGKAEVPSESLSAVPAGCGPSFSCVLTGALHTFKL